MMFTSKNPALRSSLVVGWLFTLACSSTSTMAEERPSESAAPNIPHESAPPLGEHGFLELKSDVQRLAANVDPGNAETLAGGNRHLAANLYAQLTPEVRNLFYSPYSISTAMAMTYVGARGNTKTEIAEALRFTLPDSELHLAFNGLERALSERDVAPSEDDSGLVLLANNDIWAHASPTLRPLPSYVDALAQNYSASVKLVDFDDPDGACDIINREVASQTQGTVEELLPPGVLSTDTILVLTNTIYLKAAWEVAFSEQSTQPAAFTNLDDTVSEVDTMRDERSVEYATGDGFQAARLPYVGGEIAMTVILPEPGRFAQVEQHFVAEPALDLTFAWASLDIRLPKFEIRSKSSLKQPLRNLGVHDAFLLADFSGMSSLPVFISDVLHEAFITVDEKGTEAGAATAVVFEVRGGPIGTPIEFNVNRPFILLLEDLPTQTILFAGRVIEL